MPRQFLVPCVLLLLRERPAHGYELLERLPGIGFARPQRNGRYADSGSVYRVLHKLEREGLVRSIEAPATARERRRVYESTQAGRAELGRKVEALSEASERLGAFAWRYERSRPRSSRALAPAKERSGAGRPGRRAA